MIRPLIAALGLAAAIALPGAAQTFTHTIDGRTHTHDITQYRTVGTCCVETCGSTTRTYTHAPVTRTYTRTYTHAPVTRTYTYAPQPVIQRQVYVEHRPVAPLSYQPGYTVYYHDDRDRPYAHYDSKWKSRTRGYKRGYRHP